ncbi:MAG: hypothetical protein F6J95_016695 [Leptolyngbya sp. SIO1E4]|nr:hypothetical protein [Leptolyngbya sp. SIO1E4]
MKPCDWMTRLERHRRIADDLQRLSDEDLLHAFNDAQISEVGQGKVSFRSGDASVFVKLVTLTALEMQAQNQKQISDTGEFRVQMENRVPVDEASRSWPDGDTALGITDGSDLRAVVSIHCGPNILTPRDSHSG